MNPGVNRDDPAHGNEYEDPRPGRGRERPPNGKQASPTSRFSPSEAVAIYEALEEREKKAAEERMLAGKPSANLAEGTGDTRDKVAAYVGMSGRTLEKATAVVGAAGPAFKETSRRC